MANDSSTGGYLQPGSTPAPLQGGPLNDFLHDFIVGITGLANNLVIPRWQAMPPNIPNSGGAPLGELLLGIDSLGASPWCAFGIIARRSPNFAATTFNQTTQQYGLQRHEDLDILASFYDLGESGLADTNASLLRDGLAIAQNLEPLQLANWGLVSVGEMRIAPQLLKDRWLNRVDLQFTLRRQIDRAYPVLTVKSMTGEIVTDSGLTEPLSVTPPP